MNLERLCLVILFIGFIYLWNKVNNHLYHPISRQLTREIGENIVLNKG